MARASRLQWGRDQLIAEFDGASSRGMRMLLQWGRDQLIAELRTALSHVIVRFNGAAIS